jgi:hypothetical protein
LLQPVADAARAIAQGVGRAQHDAAVGAMLGNGSGRREQARSITAWGGCHGFLLARKPGSAAASSRAALTIMLGVAIVVVNNNLPLARRRRYNNGPAGDPT